MWLLRVDLFLDFHIATLHPSAQLTFNTSARFLNHLQFCQAFGDATAILERFRKLELLAAKFPTPVLLGRRGVVIQTPSGGLHQLTVNGDETGLDLLRMLSRLGDNILFQDPSKTRLVFDNKDYIDDSCNLTMDMARIPDGALFLLCERFPFEDKLCGGARKAWDFVFGWDG